MLNEEIELDNLEISDDFFEEGMIGGDIPDEDVEFFFQHGRKRNVIEKAFNRISILFNGMSSKLKETAAVISGKKLADNKAYEGASRVSQEAVETEPRRWIIEECVPACQILWEKNIYTFMCSDGLDDDAWISLEIDCLSPENIDILRSITGNDGSSYGRGSLIANGKGKGAQEQLIKMAELFVMQDVPEKYAVISREELLRRCGCFVQIPNPEYKAFDDDGMEGYGPEDLEEYCRRLYTPEFIEQLDESKVTKSIEEYASDVGAIIDPDTGIIYDGKFHYDKHLKYIESLGNKKGLN